MQSEYISIIEETRRDILDNNNTAQIDLENIIRDLDNNITELSIQTPLSGDLDLSILKDKFKKLQSLTFGKGKITNVRNIPEGVYKLVCNNNLLNNLDDLPASLLYLDITNNFFKEFDFKKTPHIEELHCSHNKIEKLLNIPNTITKLYCAYNKLENLDLTHANNLKILICSNNPLLYVEKIPEDIHEFDCKNTSQFLETTIHYDIENDEESDNKKVNKEQKGGEKKINYIDAVNTYFKLKSKYESQLLQKKRKKYNKIFTKTGSKKTASRYASEELGNCINCKRAVGTNFHTNKEGHFASCGDARNPCKLNIHLFRGNFFQTEYFMDLYKDQLEKNKEDIIKHKLNTLFNFISEDVSINLFKKKMKEYNSDSEGYSLLFDKYSNLYDNQRKESIKNKQQQIYKILEEIKQINNEYQSNNINKELLKTSVNIYIRDLIPEIENLRRLKYDTIEMDEDRLVQREVNISKTEYTFGEYPKVVKYKGV